MLEFDSFDCPHCFEYCEWETNTIQWDDLINGYAEGTQTCKHCGKEMQLALTLEATVIVEAST